LPNFWRQSKQLPWVFAKHLWQQTKQLPLFYCQTLVTNQMEYLWHKIWLCHKCGYCQTLAWQTIAENQTCPRLIWGRISTMTFTYIYETTY
jgi:ribosomal protein L37AE/L43A